MGALLSFPLFRLRGDYFAFATLSLLPLFELLASNLVADHARLPTASCCRRQPRWSTASTSRCTPTTSRSLASVAVFVLEHLDEPHAVRLRAEGDPQRRAGGRGRRHPDLSDQAAGDGLRRDRRGRRRRQPISGRSATSTRARCSGSTSRLSRSRWRCSAAPACCGAR